MSWNELYWSSRNDTDLRAMTGAGSDASRRTTDVTGYPHLFGKDQQTEQQRTRDVDSSRSDAARTIDNSRARVDDSNLRITVSNDRYHNVSGRQYSTGIAQQLSLMRGTTEDRSAYLSRFQDTLSSSRYESQPVPPVKEIVQQTGRLLSEVNSWKPVSLQPKYDTSTAARYSATSQPQLVNISNSKYANVDASSPLAQKLLKNIDLLGKAYSGSTFAYRPDDNVTASSGLSLPSKGTSLFASSTGHGDKAFSSVVSSKQEDASAGTGLSLKYRQPQMSGISGGPASTATSTSDPIIVSVLKSIGFNFDLSKFSSPSVPKQPEQSYTGSLQYIPSNISQPVSPAVQRNDPLQSSQNVATSLKPSTTTACNRFEGKKTLSEIDRVLQKVREHKLLSRPLVKERVRSRCGRRSRSANREESRLAVKKSPRSTARDRPKNERNRRSVERSKQCSSREMQRDELPVRRRASPRHGTRTAVKPSERRSYASRSSSSSPLRYLKKTDVREHRLSPKLAVPVHYPKYAYPPPLHVITEPHRLENSAPIQKQTEDAEWEKNTEEFLRKLHEPGRPFAVAAVAQSYTDYSPAHKSDLSSVSSGSSAVVAPVIVSSDSSVDGDFGKPISSPLRLVPSPFPSRSGDGLRDIKQGKSDSAQSKSRDRTSDRTRKLHESTDRDSKSLRKETTSRASPKQQSGTTIGSSKSSANDNKPDRKQTSNLIPLLGLKRRRRKKIANNLKQVKDKDGPQQSTSGVKVQPLMELKFESDKTEQASNKDQSETTCDSSKTDSADAKLASKSQQLEKYQDGSRPHHTETGVAKADADLELVSSKEQKDGEKATDVEQLPNSSEISAAQSDNLKESGQPEDELKLKDETAPKDSELMYKVERCESVVDAESVTEQVTAEVAPSTQLNTDEITEASNNERELMQVHKCISQLDNNSLHGETTALLQELKPVSLHENQKSNHTGDDTASLETNVTGSTEWSHISSTVSIEKVEGKETSGSEIRTERAQSVDKKHTKRPQKWHLEHEVKNRDEISRLRQQFEKESGKHRRTPRRRLHSYKREQDLRQYVDEKRESRMGEKYDSDKRRRYYDDYYDYCKHVSQGMSGYTGMPLYHMPRYQEYSRESVERAVNRVHGLSDLEDISSDEGDVVYQDTGNHCCRFCHATFETISSLLKHLQSAAHEQPGIKKESPPDDSVESCTDKTSVPAQGVEFMIAISAPFYCQLCHCYSATIDEAQWHLLSANHNDKYKQYIARYPRKTSAPENRSGRIQKRKLEETDELDVKKDVKKQHLIARETENAILQVESTVIDAASDEEQKTLSTLVGDSALSDVSMASADEAEQADAVAQAVYMIDDAAAGDVHTLPDEVEKTMLLVTDSWKAAEEAETSDKCNTTKLDEIDFDLAILDATATSNLPQDAEVISSSSCSDVLELAPDHSEFQECVVDLTKDDEGMCSEVLLCKDTDGRAALDDDGALLLHGFVTRKDNDELEASVKEAIECLVDKVTSGNNDARKMQPSEEKSYVESEVRSVLDVDTGVTTSDDLPWFPLAEEIDASISDFLADTEWPEQMGDECELHDVHVDGQNDSVSADTNDLSAFGQQEPFPVQLLQQADNQSLDSGAGCHGLSNEKSAENAEYSKPLSDDGSSDSTVPGDYSDTLNEFKKARCEEGFTPEDDEQKECDVLYIKPDTESAALCGDSSSVDLPDVNTVDEQDQVSQEERGDDNEGNLQPVSEDVLVSDDSCEDFEIDML